MDGVTGPNGKWLLTPEEALEKHAVDSAKRLLTEAPKHFLEHSGRTFFCLLDLDFSPVPDWAIVYRPEGAIAIGEELTLCRPDSEVTMVVEVAGPIFQLHPKEIRLWESVAVETFRAFQVYEPTG